MPKWAGSSIRESATGMYGRAETESHYERSAAFHASTEAFTISTFSCDMAPRRYPAAYGPSGPWSNGER